MRMKKERRVVINRALVGIVVLGFMPSAAFGQAIFMGLGDLPGGSVRSQADDLSSDGSVVVGQSTGFSHREAIRWTSEGGMIGLGVLAGSVRSQAVGVSSDGSVVVGFSERFANNDEAFRWTSEGGMVGLGDLEGGLFFSRAFGVSENGSMVVGESQSAAGTEAFLWTAEGGMISLGDLPGGNMSSFAWDISGDGTVIVGKGRSALGPEAFRWTSEGGMIGLGDLPGGAFSSAASSVSLDGRVIVGSSQSTSGEEAFLWTSESGMVGLGTIPGSNSSFSHAGAVSSDGSVVVGVSGLEAFIWNADQGMQNLKEVVETQYGLNLGAWNLLVATAISSDGLTIAGAGFNPAGNLEAWILILPDSCPLDLNDDGLIDVLDLLQVVHALRTRGNVAEDLDGDGLVTPRDMHMIIRNFGICESEFPIFCPADVNGDGIVDFDDVIQVSQAIGMQGDVAEDIDHDGVVTFDDMNFVFRNFGPCDDTQPVRDKPLLIRNHGRVGGEQRSRP